MNTVKNRGKFMTSAASAWTRRKCNVDNFFKQGFGNLNTPKPEVNE